MKDGLDYSLGDSPAAINLARTLENLRCQRKIYAFLHKYNTELNQLSSELKTISILKRALSLFRKNAFEQLNLIKNIPDGVKSLTRNLICLSYRKHNIRIINSESQKYE